MFGEAGAGELDAEAGGAEWPARGEEGVPARTEEGDGGGVRVETVEVDGDLAWIAETLGLAIVDGKPTPEYGPAADVGCAREAATLGSGVCGRACGAAIEAAGGADAAISESG